MLERARAKAAARGRRMRFYLGDAENTMEPDASYDVITNRHLVWTLVDPLAAFREWHRLLKPGGKLLVVDGDFVNPGSVAKAVRHLSALLTRLGLAPAGPVNGPITAEMAATHQSILSRVYFSQGAPRRGGGGAAERDGLFDHHPRHRPARHPPHPEKELLLPQGPRTRHPAPLRHLR